ncbi:unnamed protein product, partial [Didymodactylos carnosus]
LIQLSKPVAQSEKSMQQSSSVDYLPGLENHNPSPSTEANDATRFSQDTHDNVTTKSNDSPSNQTIVSQQNKLQAPSVSIASSDVESNMSSTDQTTLRQQNEQQPMTSSMTSNGIELSTASTDHSKFSQPRPSASSITSSDTQSDMSSTDQTTLRQQNEQQPMASSMTSDGIELSTPSTDRNTESQQHEQRPTTSSTTSDNNQSNTHLWTIIGVEATRIPELKRLDKLLNEFQKPAFIDDDLQNHIDALIRILDTLCKTHYTLLETVDIEKRKCLIQSISNRLEPMRKDLKQILPPGTWKALSEQTQLIAQLCRFDFDRKPLEFAILALEYINIPKNLECELINLIDEMRREYPTLLDDILDKEYKEIKNNRREKVVITVLGSTKASKSSLINFLLQDQICPTGNQEATARLTKITYRQRICLTLKSSTINPSESTVFNNTKELLEKAKELIILKSEARKSRLCEDEILIELPIDELKNVELWDVPGFDENPIINDRVKEILKDTDLILAVIAQHESLRQTAIDFIRPCLEQNDTMDNKSKSKPVTKICFIISQIDKFASDGQSKESKDEFLQHIYDKIRQDLNIDFHDIDYKLSNQFIPMCSNHLHSVKHYLDCREQFIKKSYQWFNDALRDETYRRLNKLLESIKEFSNYDDIFRQQARYARMKTIFNRRFSMFSKQLTKNVREQLNEIYLIMKQSIDGLVEECLELYNKSEKSEKIEEYIQDQLIRKFSQVLKSKKPEIERLISKMFVYFSNAIELKPPEVQILKQVLDGILTKNSYESIITRYQHTSPYHLFTYLKGMCRALSDTLRATLKITHGDCETSGQECQKFVRRAKYVEEKTMKSITNLVNDVLETIFYNLRTEVEKTLSELLARQLKQVHTKIDENAHKYIHSSVNDKKIDFIQQFWNRNSIKIKRMHLNILNEQFNVEYSSILNINENDRLDKNKVLYIRELEHENVISYYGVKKKTEDQYYILMPRLDCNLATYLIEYSKKLTCDAIDQMIRQIIEGLDYIHTKLELVHRDIKPENILVNIDKTLFLIADLGGVHREPVTCLYTEGYAAPELFSKDNPAIITEKCDIFSLGMVIQNILRSADIEQHDDRLIIGWSKLSKKCCSKEPAARPSCKEILKIRFKYKQRSSDPDSLVPRQEAMK